MTVRLYKNNASNTLNGAITDSDTTITLNDASSFPTPGAGEIAYATLDDQNGTVEVISYTGISTNDLTGVTRAQEGTSASAFDDGDLIEQRATALSFTDVLAADKSPKLRGVLDASVTSVYYSFGGSSTSTKYCLNHSGGLPRLYGNSNFYYGFTSSAIYIQAGTTFNRLEVTNDSNRFRFYTKNSLRFTINDSGATVNNGDLIVDSDSTGVVLGDGQDATIYYDGTDLHIDPQTVGSGDTIFDNGNIEVTGISFDSGSNVLDYYEEGSFTPTVTAATPGDLSVSYTNQIGSYVRVGNIVVIGVFLTFDPTYTTASGDLRIGGLPFNPGNNFGVGTCRSTSSNFAWGTDKTQLVLSGVGSTDQVRFTGLANSTTAANLDITTAFTSGATGVSLIFGLTYYI